MGFEVQLLTGIGELLHRENVGRWLTTGSFGPNDTQLSIDQLLPSPDKGIAISLYPVDDNTGTTDSTIGLQLLIRGSPGNKVSVKDIGDRAFDALHDLKNTEIGGVPIIRIWRQSGANLGADASNRQESSQNYYIQLTRTGAHRAD
jgi:hypothetical protein